MSDSQAVQDKYSLTDVIVVLASFNGARFLPEQLESILAQDYPRLSLVARDDGSADGSDRILADYAARYPHRITLLPAAEHSARRKGGGQARDNFAHLLDYVYQQHRGSDDNFYLLFADQDDVWLNDKVSIMVQALAAEECGNEAVPVLVYSDLAVVDEQLNVLAGSAFDAQHIGRGAHALESLLLQNCVTGASAALNRAALATALPIPDTALMHDHWLALVCAATGRIRFIDQALVYYRQHGANVVGATFFGWRYLLLRALAVFSSRGQARVPLSAYQAQARSLLERCRGQMVVQQAQIIAAFAGLPEQSWLERRKTLRRYHLRRSGWLRNLVLWLEA